MTGNLPLTNKRIVITRSPDQAQALCAQLEVRGATCIYLPAIEFKPLPAPDLDKALAHLDSYDWLIFTSSNAVRFFLERAAEGKRQEAVAIWGNQDDSPRIAAVGSATQKRLAENGLSVDFIPEKFTGEQLVLGLGDISGQRILLPRAKIGRPEIITMLREHGAIVDEIALYDTVTAVPTPQALAELEKGVDIITFTSPSSVRNFLEITGALRLAKPQRFLVAVIGPSTAAEARKLGLPVDIMPDEYTIDGLVNAIAGAQHAAPLPQKSGDAYD